MAWANVCQGSQFKSGFNVEDFLNAQLQTVHAQRMIPYAVHTTSQHASKKLIEQATHYDTTYHLVDKINNIRKLKGKLQALIESSGLNEDFDQTSETLTQPREKMPGVLQNVLRTAQRRISMRDALGLCFQINVLLRDIHEAL